MCWSYEERRMLEEQERLRAEEEERRVERDLEERFATPVAEEEPERELVPT